MTRIFRLCPACAQEVALESPRCPHCQCDTQTDYWPAPTTSPLQKVKAALPAVLAVGVVTLQVGMALARNPLVQGLWQRAARHSRKPERGVRKQVRMRIRTRWFIEGPNGLLERGQQESIFEDS